jgi:hypothetical protein
MMSRREVLKAAGQVGLWAAGAPLASALVTSESGKGPKALRCINVVNFIREIEPRFTMNMMLPVRKQMEIIKSHGLPATWLLQFDALVSGPFVEFLKAEMPKGHEVGFWFEMNERHCKAAGVEWRGRPGYEWDHIPHVAFTIGYTPEERVKLADTAMAEFKRVWGRYPKSVASWNLDAITMAHLTERYGIDAYAVCRDQITTDGFTIWGAPIAGYYPSKANCWSPALDVKNQIGTPVFRMLGQDPVYYYDRGYHLPDGRWVGEPDTMEPVWTSGRSSLFVERFLGMISDAPTGSFAYAQLGQENTFPWDQQAEAYPKQMAALASLRSTGRVHVETMGESGRRFKKAFRTTPVQAQVQLEDPFGNTAPAEGSIWYQSRFYRADLHFKGDLFYLRDLTVYSDQFEQPFLHEPTRLTEVEQKLPTVMDGYHWKGDGPCGGFFEVDGESLSRAGKSTVREEGPSLVVEMPVSGGRVLTVRFEERRMVVRCSSGTVALTFRWDPAKAPAVEVVGNRASYRWKGFDYFVGVGGEAKTTAMGWMATEVDRIRRAYGPPGLILLLEQPH